MKSFKFLLAGLALIALSIPLQADQSNTTLKTFQAGSRLINGTDLNTNFNLLNQSVVKGEIALDGANPTPVATGLTTVTVCHVGLKLATAPGVGTSVATYSTTSGTLNIYGWKVTTSTDNTLIASTGTETIGYICYGTK